MKRLKFRSWELPRSEVPQTNLLPGAGQQARLARSARWRRWLVMGLLAALVLLLALAFVFGQPATPPVLPN